MVSTRKPVNLDKSIEQGLYLVALQIKKLLWKANSKTADLLEPEEAEQLRKNVATLVSSYEKGKEAVQNLTKAELAMSDDELLAEIKKTIKAVEDSGEDATNLKLQLLSD